MKGSILVYLLIVKSTLYGMEMVQVTTLRRTLAFFP